MEGVLAGPGTVLAGRYTIERELGRGGMAVVYLARDMKHRRLVAAKILRPEISASLGSDRFLREIEIAAHLTHPHILPLHDSGESGDLLYYIMPFVEGESLRERLRREGKLPVEEAIRITREVADGLAYAHARGIVHRDIKPGNILLESGHAVVADFGIARALSEAAGEEITTSGLAIGTPMYMSPEQVAGGAIDGRSDLYSLGCVLYEMLSGETPFTGPNARAVAARHFTEQPRSLSSIGSPVPSHVSAAVEKVLAKSPDDRYSDAAGFAEALITADVPTLSRKKGRFARWIWVGALTIAAGLAGSFVLMRRTPGLTSPRQPSWVLMAAFEGASENPGIADAVRELVAAELDQSRDVATLPRQQVAEVMREAGLADTVTLTPTVARELAFRSSVRAILSGSVSSIGPGRHSIVLRVLDAESGKPLLSVSGAATDADLVPQVQELGREIRRGLGERRSAIETNKPLAEVATPSFDAYRKYVDALTLANTGDVDGSNRLLRQALALDTGFAAAWASLSVNYAMARNADSSRLALEEALKRPDRLNVAQRYRLEGEAAYRLRYDLPAAVRWYELHLAYAPQSVSGHNNRGVYLSSLGRYQEALNEFRIAERIDPFGKAQSQIQLFNQAAMLLALGRIEEASEISRQLTGAFAEYAALLQGTAMGRWSEVEHRAAAAAADPESPPWFKPAAITMWAGSLSARGAVAAADQVLRRAAAAAQGPQRWWYLHAALLLKTASGSKAPSPSVPIADTSAGGLTIRGLTAAVNGDTTVARRILERLAALSPVEQLRLGAGPRLISAWIAAHGRHWVKTVDVLGPAAKQGEHDGSSPEQVASIATRWLVANAYEQVGKLDSAAAYFDLAVEPTRVPFSHLALRGLVYPFAQYRLAMIYKRMGRPQDAARHLDLLARDFVTPDPDMKVLLSGPNRMP
jgi:serine/threonine-protein kinase